MKIRKLGQVVTLGEEISFEEWKGNNDRELWSESFNSGE